MKTIIPACYGFGIGFACCLLLIIVTESFESTNYSAQYADCMVDHSVLLLEKTEWNACKISNDYADLLRMAEKRLKPSKLIASEYAFTKQSPVKGQSDGVDVYANKTGDKFWSNDNKTLWEEHYVDWAKPQELIFEGVTVASMSFPEGLIKVCKVDGTECCEVVR